MISLRSEKRGEGFKFRFYVILVKYSFIVLANKGSSEISLSFSSNTGLFEISPLLLKKGLIVFQNFLLSLISMILIFSKKIF